MKQIIFLSVVILAVELNPNFGASAADLIGSNSIERLQEHIKRLEEHVRQNTLRLRELESKEARSADENGELVRRYTHAKRLQSDVYNAHGHIRALEIRLDLAFGTLMPAIPPFNKQPICGVLRLPNSDSAPAEKDDKKCSDEPETQGPSMPQSSSLARSTTLGVVERLRGMCLINPRGEQE